MIFLRKNSVEFLLRIWCTYYKRGKPDDKKEPASMENENRHKRKLSELSLIDDYLFGLFVQESKNEEMLKELIERMLDIKLSKVRL